LGNNTVERVTPQVIGIEILSVLNILTRRRRRNLVANVLASAIHELSTPCARRVNNQTLVVPATKRAITASAPAIQASNTATFQSKPFKEGETGFGAASNRGETGFDAGDSAPTSQGGRRASEPASGSCPWSGACAAAIAPDPAGSRDPLSTEATVDSDGSAAIRQEGSATDSTGSASRLAIARLQTRCLDAAEALRSEPATNPATDKIMALLMKASSSS